MNTSIVTGATWWIGDLSKFQTPYPGWRLTRGIPEILNEIHEHNQERWLQAQ